MDNIIGSIKTPETADEFLAGVLLALTAEDMTESQRAAFATGILTGLTYALVMHIEDRIPEAAQTLLRLKTEWEANGVL